MKRMPIVLSFFLTLSAMAQENQTDSLALPPVEVRATRAGSRSPFTKTNLSKNTIEKANQGLDLPFILNATPSTVVSSDAGNGVGYTGLRIRGSDLTRINVTLNGVPYNDPESQSVYFVDLPDFASSVSSLQIQRGVGTSSNGPGAFGASLNLSTNEVNLQPYLSLFNTVGSFNTRRHTVKLGTGLLNNHFTVDARLSLVSSDGFIDRASSDLKSYYLSGAWINGKSSIRLNLFSGKEKTYQAWNGVPEFKLFYNADSLLTHYYNNLGSLYFTEADSVNLFTANPRTYNGYLYPNQTDNYQQNHYQLFFNTALAKKINLSTALFLTHGEGYYEEYKYGQRYSSYGLPDFVSGGSTTKKTDLVRQLWLNNDLYGGNLSLEYKEGKMELTAGGNFSRFEGHHFGRIVWAAQGIAKDYEWYRHPASKNDLSLYGKLNYDLGNNLSAMVDLQFRTASHQINGTRKFPELKLDTSFQFLNPKAGLFYSLGSISAYVSYAVANKEPNRTDFEVANNQRPHPEQLHDLEAGIEHKGKQASYGLTLFYMRYKDQLVLTGQINDVGDAIRINVPESFRLGAEAWGGTRIAKWLRVEGNITLSDNKLKNYTDYIPRYDLNFDFAGYDTLSLKDVPIAFSPAMTAFASLTASPAKNLELTVSGKAVSKQYLDNTGNENKTIRPYVVQDAGLRYKLPLKGLKETELYFQVNNLWDREWESNGYTYSYYYDSTLVRENFYYPMAGRNFLVGLSVKL